MLTPKIIFDNIHGNIQITDLEREIIDTKIFQRLRLINQLGLAEYVFPGATHTRFSHSIGSMYAISEMFNSLSQNVGDRINIPVEDKEVVRLVGLLHDLGHLPFSHVFENKFTEKTGLTHEDLTVKLIKESEIGRILDKNKYQNLDQELLFNILEKNFTPSEEHQLNYVSLIDSNIDSDKLDYLTRDSLYTGVGYGAIEVDRILKTISIDDSGTLCIKNKSMQALENFCIARYHMYQTVYFHKTVVAFEKMLSKIYELMINDDYDIITFEDIKEMSPDTYCKFRDSYMWEKIINYSGENNVIKELCNMLLSHTSIKLVVDDPQLVNPGDRVRSNLNLLKYDAHQQVILDKMECFDIEWLFVADSRTKFRKSDYENDPIKIEIQENGELEWVDVSTLRHSIMNQLQKEYVNIQVFTHEKYEDELRKVIRENYSQ